MSDVQISYLQSPADIVNQSLDMLGVSGQIIGSLTDGTKVSETARRNYGQALRQLLRCAWWDHARKRAQLNLLGTTSIVPPPLGVSGLVEWPWQFCYEWPTDAVFGRWMPYSPTTNQPTNAQGIPLLTGNSLGVPYPQIPGRFLVTSSDQYPTETGFTPWNQLPDYQRTIGVGPTTRQVILTNCCNAWFVYTTLTPVIETWPSDFRQAMVVMMAMVLAPVAIEEPKLRMAEIGRLAPLLKNTIDNARAASANESGFPQSVDREAPWLAGRNPNWWGGRDGGFGFGDDGGGGSYSCGFGSMSWGGSVF
jgi:hypothetical protein